MKRIAIEEHFRTEYYLDYLQSRKKYPKLESIVDEKGNQAWRLRISAKEWKPWLPKPIMSKLCDIGEVRLKEMDEAGVNVQVLSFNDNIDWIDVEDARNLARRINDDLSQAIKRNPDRFAGFAALAPTDPKSAADELRRAVKQLGFKGAMILPHVGGEFIDARRYWPIFEEAANLGVPLYMHPQYPPPDRLKAYSGYPELSGPVWGFGAETGLAAVRLIWSGVFDEYPRLKIILGHLGEALPFWMWRVDNRMRREADTTTPAATNLKKLPSQYIKDNFFVTTSGMLWLPALLCTQQALGAAKILFAVDYPFEPSREAVRFIEAATISEGDKGKIFHLNVEGLLGL